MLDVWNNLANAIVVQACKDYEEEYYRDDVEVFLKGEWFKSLTDLNGERLLKELKKKVAEEELIKIEKKNGIKEIRRKRGY